jgi:hypothetical protein
METLPEAAPNRRRPIVLAFAFACAAHIGVLVVAAHVTPPPAPKPSTRIENVLLGHVDVENGGDFVAEGMVRARIRNR